MLRLIGEHACDLQISIIHCRALNFLTKVCDLKNFDYHCTRPPSIHIQNTKVI